MMTGTRVLGEEFLYYSFLGYILVCMLRHLQMKAFSYLVVYSMMKLLHTMW